MCDISDEEQSGNLSDLRSGELHWKIDATFKPLSSDRRDEIFELVKFLIYLRKNNLKGRSKYQQLTKVENVLNNYLGLLEQVKQGYIVSQPTSIQDVNPLKSIQDAIISHLEIEKLHIDEFESLIEVAMFLQGKNPNNLNRVEGILHSWLRKAQNIQ